MEIRCCSGALERSLTAELEVPKSNRQDRQLEKNKTKFSNLLGSEAVTTTTTTIDAPRWGSVSEDEHGESCVCDVTMWDPGHALVGAEPLHAPVDMNEIFES